MKSLGIISGTLFMQGKGIFADLREETVETQFGRASSSAQTRSSSSPVTGRIPIVTSSRTSSTTRPISRP